VDGRARGGYTAFEPPKKCNSMVTIRKVAPSLANRKR
jgi:hypothetical protein